MFLDPEMFKSSLIYEALKQIHKILHNIDSQWA